MIACDLDREVRGRLHQAVLERGRGGHDLEGRAGGLRGREGDAGERPDLAVARVERGDAAESAREPHHGGLLKAGVDGRPDRLGRPRLCSREHAVRPQPARRPGARAAAARTPPRARSGPTGQSAGKPCAYSAARSSAVSCGSMRPAIESAIPTSGEVRASPGPAARTLPSRERSVARIAGTLTRRRRSPRAQLREHEPRRPVHLLARHRDAQVAAEAPEHACLDYDGHGHVTAVQRLRVARFEVGHRGGGGRAAVGAPEARDRKARACLVAQQNVHRRACRRAPRPRRSRRAARSACDRVLDPDDCTRRQRNGREPCKGREGAMSEAPSALGGNALHGSGDRASEVRPMVPTVNSLNPR